MISRLSVSQSHGQAVGSVVKQIGRVGWGSDVDSVVNLKRVACRESPELEHVGCSHQVQAAEM